MRYLFFLVGFFYSLIFYFFYTFSLNKSFFFKDLDFPKNIQNLGINSKIIFSTNEDIIIQSFFGNLIIEVIIFFIIAISLFILFSSKNLKPIKDKNIKKEEKNIINKKNLFLLLNNFSYYFGFALFYISIYFISLSFEKINFSLLILIISLLIYLFFIFSKFSKLSKDFLKINSIIFSLFYIFSYIFIFFTKENFFTYIDFINSFLIIFTFPSLMYYDKIIQKNINFDSSITLHFSLYLFFVIVFYISIFFHTQNLLFHTSIISVFFGILLFNFLPKLPLFCNDELVFKYIGINFTYFGIFLIIIFLFGNFSLFLLLILLFSIIYNFFIHFKFQNYISLIIGILSLIFIVFYSNNYFNLIEFKSKNFVYFTLIFSYLFLLISYILKFKTKYEYYILNFFSYLINIFGIILFFIFIDFEFLFLGVLLFIESTYFFLSYFRLKKY